MSENYELPEGCYSLSEDFLFDGLSLPFELNYNINIMSLEQYEDIIDGWNKILYTNHYKIHAREIIESRYPSGNYDHIPGMDEVFETMISNLQVTPLEEYEARGLKNNNIGSHINGENTNILEFEKSE